MNLKTISSNIADLINEIEYKLNLHQSILLDHKVKGRNRFEDLESKIILELTTQLENLKEIQRILSGIK